MIARDAAREISLAFVLVLSLSLAAAAQDAAAERRGSALDTSPKRIAELIAKLDGGTMADRVRANRAYKELVKIGRPAVPQLLDAAGGDKPWVRMWAGAALAQTGDQRAVEALLEIMEDPLVEARMIAVWHSAGLHRLDRRIAAAVVQRLGDGNERVRAWAQRALTERIKFRGAVAELEKMTRSDSLNGRTLAFKLLMQHRGQGAAGTIGKTLSEQEDWHVRSAAVRCLGEGVLRPHQPMFDLLFRAMDDASEEVRADAVQVMDHVLKETAGRMPREVRTPIMAKLKEKLPPMLDAGLPRLRGASLYLSAAVERERIFDCALAGVDDPSPVVRAFALRALYRCGVKNWHVVDKALARLEDEDLEVRRRALSILRWATGATFEFKPEAPAEERAEAAGKIRERIETGRAR